MTMSAASRPVQSRPLAVLAAIGLPVPLMREVGEVGEPLDGADDHAARRRRRRRRSGRRAGRISHGGS